jgi:predicted nuclease of predicted toxin-antitoxin system
VKLLLDEMWSHTIASELRRRGFDVIAASEVAQASRFAGISDDAVFARAQEEGRTVVTDNVGDYETARLTWESSQGTPHPGVIYALDPPFNRHQPAVVGQMVRALARFLREQEKRTEPFNRPHWLQPVPS